MNDERWFDLIDRIRTQFGDVEEHEEPLEPGPGKRHTVEFRSPMGRMKLERVSRPVVIERRARYSKRIGAQTSEDLVYAEGEVSHRVSLYRWAAGSWVEQDYRGILD